MKKKEILLTELWAIIYITSELNFCQNLQTYFLKKNWISE